MRILPFIPTALAVLATVPAPTGAASTGSGSFRMDKTKSTFSAACGFKVPNAEAPGSTQVVVVLASKPLDCAAYDAGFTPVEDAEEAMTEKKGAIVVLKIDPSGESINGNWNSVEPSDSFSFGGQGTVQLTRNTDTRVEGRHWTKAPDKFFDKTYEFDFKFAVDVLTGAVEGNVLPKGGGEPGAVFQSYIKALGKKDNLPAARKFVTDEYGSSLEYTRGMELKQATISGGLVKGTRAALDVAGTSFDGEKKRGRVYLVQEGGAWKVSDNGLRMVFD